MKERTIIRVAALAIVVVFLLSVAGIIAVAKFSFSESQFNSIEVGTPVEQVLERLGRPDEDWTSPRYGTRTLTWTPMMSAMSYSIEITDGKVSAKERIDLSSL